MIPWKYRLLKGMMILSTGVLPGAAIDCDLEDGEFDLDLDGLGFDFDDDEWCCDGGFYYEEVYCDPWGWCY